MQYCNCTLKHDFQYMIAIAQHMSAIQPYEYISAIYKCYCNTINFIAMHTIINSNTNILTLYTFAFVIRIIITIQIDGNTSMQYIIAIYTNIYYWQSIEKQYEHFAAI